MCRMSCRRVKVVQSERERATAVIIRVTELRGRAMAMIQVRVLSDDSAAIASREKKRESERVEACKANLQM